MPVTSESTCDCPKCNCKLGEHPIACHGKHYCCEGCAKHHEHGEACSSKGCKCAHG
ncbi:MULTISPECIES: metallothionein [unclassified Pseudomonas]|uniref:metallothionein n=1 Tax=unclassified Pseudomonas TaxID=196821 RepID=UPI0030DD7DAF